MHIFDIFFICLLKACHISLPKGGDYSNHMITLHVDSRQMDAFHGEGILQTKHFVAAADMTEEDDSDGGGDGHRIVRLHRVWFYKGHHQITTKPVRYIF